MVLPPLDFLIVVNENACYYRYRGDLVVFPENHLAPLVSALFSSGIPDLGDEDVGDHRDSDDIVTFSEDQLPPLPQAG